MNFEDTMPLQIPLNAASEGDDEALSDRLTMYAEYVDVTQFFPQEDY